MHLKVGTTYIAGHDSETGKQIFRACANVKVNPKDIRTTDSGFLVPDVVADEVQRLRLPEWSETEAVF